MIPHCSRAFDHDFLCRQDGVKMATRARRAIDRLTLKGTNPWGQAGSCVPIPLQISGLGLVRSLALLAPVLSVRLSRSGRSCQFGLASAPIVPQRVQTLRPNEGTCMASGQGSTLSTPLWWHCQQRTDSDRPCSRMLPSVIGIAGADDRGIRDPPQALAGRHQ
jgi:hypothetical protein